MKKTTNRVKKAAAAATTKGQKAGAPVFFSDAEICKLGTLDLLSALFGGRISQEFAFPSSPKGTERGTISFQYAQSAFCACGALKRRITEIEGRSVKSNASAEKAREMVSEMQARHELMRRLGWICIGVEFPQVLSKGCGAELAAGWKLIHTGGVWDEYLSDRAGVLDTFVRRLRIIFATGEVLPLRKPLPKPESGGRKITVIKDDRLRSLRALQDIITHEQTARVPTEVLENDQRFIRDMKVGDLVDMRFGLYLHKMIHDVTVEFLTVCIAEIVPFETGQFGIYDGWKLVKAPNVEPSDGDCGCPACRASAELLQALGALGGN